MELSLEDVLKRRQDMEVLKQRVNKMVNDGIYSSFDIEMDIMATLPEIYSDFPMIVKHMVKVGIVKNIISSLKSKNITSEKDIIRNFKSNPDLKNLYETSEYLVKSVINNTYLDNMMDKMLDSLEAVARGNKSLASTELTMGMELKEKFLDPHMEKLNKK